MQASSSKKVVGVTARQSDQRDMMPSDVQARYSAYVKFLSREERPVQSLKVLTHRDFGGVAGGQHRPVECRLLLGGDVVERICLIGLCYLSL
jgi:hypothetical protein